MTISGLTFGLTAPYFVTAIGDGNPYMAFLYQSIIGVCLSFWGSPMMAWMVEYFDPAARLTSAAVGYSIGMGIAGGGSPACLGHVHGFQIWIPIARISLDGSCRCVALWSLDRCSRTTRFGRKETRKETAPFENIRYGVELLCFILLSRAKANHIRYGVELETMIPCQRVRNKKCWNVVIIKEAEPFEILKFRGRGRAEL
jgi:hypothetical protein